MASSSTSLVKGSQIQRPSVMFGVPCSSVRTTPQRLWECIEKQNDSKIENGIINELFAKQLLTNDDINFSSTHTLFSLVVKAIRFDIVDRPSNEKLNYVKNIKKIYDDLLQRPDNNLKAHENALIVGFLEGYSQVLNKPIQINRSLTQEYSVKDNQITSQMRGYRPPSIILQKNLVILKKDPMQWLFRVLELESETHCSESSFGSGRIRPDVFVLCYKAFTTTEEFLRAVCDAIRDKEFSDNEREKTQKNLIYLLGRWIFSRHHINDLLKDNITLLFEETLQLLDESPFKTVRDENDILRACFKNSLVVTPRKKAESFSFEAISGIFKKMIERKDPKACKDFAYEIHCYLIDYINQVPIEEFFCNLGHMQTTAPYLAELSEGINKFEQWLAKKFEILNEKDKMRFARSILCTMEIARGNSDFQTIFSLITVMNNIKYEKRRHQRQIQEALKEFEGICDLSGNFKSLRESYKDLEKNGTKYLPLTGVAMHDLAVILEKEKVISFGDLKIFNIQRFNLLYKTVRPYIAMKINRAAMVPKTNMKFMIWSESAAAASSSSGVLDVPA